ncbi:hypothetical protein O181_038743 [Austropuccinia psidii MF-1]|uniref:Secreted protein n=1 Tax=Austropuccinia psidii MF-1 TaxID=1389203 RepID=A0A9Q3HBA4_9BASI|nr:hypothetical protein [Austropuccinia psidii MF-1]
MAHVLWNANVCLFWFLALVHDPNALHKNPYPCPGSGRFTRKILHWGSLPTIPTIPYACPGSQIFTYKILTLIKVQNYSNKLLSRTASQNLGHLLMQVQAPNASHANAYAWKVANNSNNCLCQGRLLKIHTQILMRVQVPKASHAHLYACTGS